MTSTKRIVGNNIQHLLKMHHMSQADLYRKIGSNSASVNEWIHGKKMPELDSLEKIADVFCVPISELFIDRSVLYLDEEEKAATSYYLFLRNNPDAMAVADIMMSFSKGELSALRVMANQIKNLRKQEV